MKKRIKITAVIFAIVFCTLLGCERKEREDAEFLLSVETEEELAAGSEDLMTAGESDAKWASAAAGVQPASQRAEGAAAEYGSQPEAGMAQGAGQIQANAGMPSTAGDSVEKRESHMVHVCGAVMEPGVYRLDAGSRIYQAIEKAGGFMPGADENYLNQADLLSDGMKIYVPTLEEVEAAGGEIEWKTAAFAETGEVQKETTGQEGVPVNINTAGEAQLCTLPGVGSSKAKSIIAYREKNGAYQKIEDIMNVEGIKDGVFQKIKDSITV